MTGSASWVNKILGTSSLIIFAIALMLVGFFIVLISFENVQMIVTMKSNEIFNWAILKKLIASAARREVATSSLQWLHVCTYCDVFALGELKNVGLPVHPQFLSNVYTHNSSVTFAPTIRQKNVQYCFVIGECRWTMNNNAYKNEIEIF